MLIRIITHYLRDHKRLVVPQLGAFLVREEPYAVLFSELIRRDDGVLQSLLVAEGMSEIAARGEIDRFVYEVRHAVQQGEPYHLSDFGVMRPGHNDTILFEYHARLSVAPEVPVDIIPDLIEKLREEPKRPERVERSVVEPTPLEPTPLVEEAEQEAAPTPEEEELEFEEVAPLSATEPRRIELQQPTFKEADDDEEEELDFEEEELEAAPVRRAPRPAAKRQQAAAKKPDYFMIVAIVVAVIALMAIGYGMYSNAQTADEPEEEYIERVEIDPAMLEAAGVGEA